jgi:hypothetical protein
MRCAVVPFNIQKCQANPYAASQTTSSVTAFAVPPSPQGEGLDKLQFDEVMIYPWAFSHESSFKVIISRFCRRNNKENATKNDGRFWWLTGYCG